MKKIYNYISLARYNSGELNAGPKAKLDVERILKEDYNCICKSYNIDDKNYFEKIIKIIKKSFFIITKCNKRKNIIIQWPFTVNKVYEKFLSNQTVLIHDVNGIRKNDNTILKKEIDFFNKSRDVIVHNNQMKNILIENGLEEKKVRVLEVFDYLTSKEINTKPDNCKELTIVYSGNSKKSPFLFELDENMMNFKINLYGVLNEKINNYKIEYKGMYKPDDGPEIIKGNLGLVWDGHLDSSDENDSLKAYTKYNSPHKLSCYLAANIPVVVWSKAAVSEFVKENNIGYVIDKIYDLNNLDFSDYETKVKNAQIIGDKIRKGYYTRKIFNEVLERKI